MRYRSRVVDGELRQRLSSTGAVVIEGPKACGKTATARNLAASEVLLDVDENARQAVAIDPRLLLAGDSPRLIDEWQIEPAIWNHIRRAVDERVAPGQFILTGSAVIPIKSADCCAPWRAIPESMRPQPAWPRISAALRYRLYLSIWPVWNV